MEPRAEVNAEYGELVKVRRALHRMPELAWEERGTQEYVFTYLKALAPDVLVKIAGTGVKAVFYAQGATKTTAFRADMDALPMAEETGIDCASEHGGVMHSCGHDSHMAAALVTAKLVAKNRAKLQQNVVFLFQPAEEINEGARRMIAEGALAAPQVDRLFGYHVLPGVPVGKIGIRPGSFMARADGIEIVVNGRSAHGAMPYRGVDAIVAASELVLSLQTIVSRSIPSTENVVFTIGAMNGGTLCNIVCDRVTLKCSIRTFGDEIFERVHERALALMRGIEAGYGTTCEWTSAFSVPAVINDAGLAGEMRSALGEAAYELEQLPISEDFSYYGREVRSFFGIIGIGDAPALHNPRLFFDERALLYPVEANLRLLGI